MTKLFIANQEDWAADAALSAAVAWKIHPSIGIARVGNSPTEFFLGSEDPSVGPCHRRRDAGDADNLFVPRVKRQGARFRVFAYDAAGACLGEVTGSSVRALRWSVTLANRKASGPRIGRAAGGSGGARPVIRNKHVPAGERWRLEITPRPRQVCGANQRAVFDDGRFMDIPVTLGELRTDADDRLIVLGGFGKAGTHDAGKRIRDFTDNDGWYDDISDGSVCATITLRDGRTVTATPSWVVVTAPDFAPGLSPVATQFDVLIDLAILRGLRCISERPSFRDDIAPILVRIASMQWLNGRALGAFGRDARSGGCDIQANWTALAGNGPEGKALRERVLAEVTKHGGERWMRVTHTQRQMLMLWAAGTFEADWSEAPMLDSAADRPISPDTLDRTSLESCAAGVLFADPERADIAALFMPGEAFRLDHGKLDAGAITQFMACPWQADLLEGTTSWSPAPCPETVLTTKRHEELKAFDAHTAALPTDGSEDEQLDLLRERRRMLWTARESWTRGLPTESPAREESLVKEWRNLGFVSSHSADGCAFLCAGKPCFVETERNPYLGSMGEYFHWLVNIEVHRDFTPKALELALGMLEDAKFSAAHHYAPFRYAPDTFDERLDKIYADFVDKVMYNPVPWESGEISWEAIVDYDQDGDPVWNERRFHVGRFSDHALKERFRQFGPLNLTDGAWLQNILSALPAEGVRTRLFSIWLDEAGNGRPEFNHSNVYETLLRSLNIYMPPVTSRDFIEQDLVRSAFESTVFQLCVGLFPRRFLPELLGMTLFVEWEATPTMEPIGKMMAARNIDPQYYRMHAAIDNINVGHGALAKEAIKLYLHQKEQEGGDAVVQEHWQRIWRGYVAWSTLGNGADEVVERMMIVDKKQIHLRSSLLLSDDILPPLVAALRSAREPLSEHLRAGLSLPTRAMLENWSPAEPPARALLDGLCRELNVCLRAGIHDERRLAGVALSAPTLALLRLAPRHGVEVIDLGRALLEDAYPDGIARRPGFPDIKRYYAGRMANLIRSKTRLALQSHRRKAWLIDAFRGPPEQLMRALVERGLIDIDHPSRSRLFERLEFNGPMYKVFTDEERGVVMDWIESLRADGPAVSRPLPAVSADPAHAMLDLLERRAAEGIQVGAHGTAPMGGDGHSVMQWLERGPRALMQALAATPSMIKPSDPDHSAFLDLISESGPMAGVFSGKEVAIIHAWIAGGATLPGPRETGNGGDSAGQPEHGDAGGERRWRIGMGSVH